MLSKEGIRAIKRAHPVADVVAGYGIQLRRSGRSLVGRCPFHHDQGRPTSMSAVQPTRQTISSTASAAAWAATSSGSSSLSMD